MTRQLQLKNLQKNLLYVMQEMQLKIGISGESVKFYYPLDELNGFFAADYSVEEMTEALKSFQEYIKNSLGEIKISVDGKRFCFVIGQKGIDYARNELKNHQFLAEFIALTKSACTLDDVLNLFRKYSNDVVCKEVDNEEFDHLVYFANGEPDNFYYCLQFEFDHMHYHRFTPQDFKAFGFEIE